MPDEMYEYLTRQCDMGTISEYLRSLIRRDQERRADYAARPRALPARANETTTFVDALDQLEKLKAILERKETYDY